jgi:hypothetical protein
MKPQSASPSHEVLAGLVERVTFHNSETGFCVLRMKARGHRDLVTIVGHAATICAGEWITASGEWVNDRTHAIDPEAAAIKGIRSEVAGRALILVVPDLEAGNMLAKNLTFLASADAAGIVLGARVPIILTSRADSVRTRMASCAVAVLYADARRRAATQPPG